jgi:hypothetical protein
MYSRIETIVQNIDRDSQIKSGFADLNQGSQMEKNDTFKDKQKTEITNKKNRYIYKKHTFN